MRTRLFCLSLLAGAWMVGLATSAEKTASAVVWDVKAATHLLSRTSFAASPEAAARLAALPLEQAVDQMLTAAAQATPPGRPDWVREQWINRGRRWSDMSREEYLAVLRRNTARNAAELNDLRAWWVGHMIVTPTPLREEMTLFWHGHFTSATGKVNSFAQAFYQQNATWRRHALGNFRQFLEAVTLDPCMLSYLDLERSHKDHPNENYARELLELFTLGVGNYTEKDILEIARALTGWDLHAPPGTVVVDRPTDADRLQFPSITRDGMTPRFNPDGHDSGQKTIFGKTGAFGLKEVLDLIVEHPACSVYLAGRLIDYFGAVDPNGSLRTRMAAAFRASGYEIQPMLRVLLTSPEFYSDASRGNRIKSPVRLVVGACRDLKLDVKATPSLAHLPSLLGQELFNPPTVKGWPQGSALISASTLVLRQRLAESLLDGHELNAQPLGRLRLRPLSRDTAQAEATTRRMMEIDAERRQQQGEAGLRVRFDPARLATSAAADEPTRLVDLLLERLVVSQVRPITRTAIAEACARVPASERASLAVRLILASPEYQLY